MFIGNDILPKSFGNPEPIWIPAPSSGGAIALIAHTGIQGNPSGAGPTSGVDTTGSNSCFVAVQWYELAADPAIADSFGNTGYVKLTSYTGPGNTRTAIFYKLGATCGPGHTWTASGSTVYASIEAAAFSNVLTSGAFDVENGASAAATTIQPGSITPSVNGSLILTCVCAQNNTTPSINLGFTITDDEQYAAANNFGGTMAYLIQTSAAAVNPTWTLGSGNYSAAIASFKPA